MKRSESVTSAKKISQCLNVDKSQESGIYLSLNTSIFLASSPALRVLQKTIISFRVCAIGGAKTEGKVLQMRNLLQLVKIRKFNTLEGRNLRIKG